MYNKIHFTLSQESCDKLASIAKIIPSAEGTIYHSIYDAIAEKHFEEKHDAFYVTGTYMKNKGLDMEIGINDSLIDVAVDAFATFIPAFAGALASLSGHMNRLKKMFNHEKKETEMRVKRGDKVTIMYVIGRKSKPVVKEITIGGDDLHDIDERLIGCRIGTMIRHEIDVLGTSMPMTIMIKSIDRVVNEEVEDITVNMIHDSEDQKEAEDTSRSVYGGNPAVRFSYCERDSGSEDDNSSSD